MNKKEAIKDLIKYTGSRKEKSCGQSCPISYFTKKYFGKDFLNSFLDDEYKNFINQDPIYRGRSSNCVQKLACMLKNFGLNKFSDVEKFIVREGHKSSFCLCKSMDKVKLFEKIFGSARDSVKI